MFILFFRYLFLSLCAFYIYACISVSKHTSKQIYSYFIPFSIVIASIISLFHAYDAILRITILLFLSLVCIIMYENYSLKYALSITSISYGLSYIFLTLSGTITGTLFFIVFKSQHNFSINYTYIPTGIFQLFITFITLKSKQFRNGLTNILTTKKSLFGAIVSVIIILYIALISTQKQELRLLRALIILILLLLSLLLYYYWRRRIKQTYIENMRRLEILTYENTIAEKDKQINELEENNAHLGQIIHKYTKVIPAMELSVTELLQNSGHLNHEELKQKAVSLQTQLKTLQNERDNLLDKYQKGTVIATQTGLHTIDALLALMGKRAKQEWIRYKMQITPNIRDLATDAITEADLLHLLGDLIENAFHAVNLADNKEILIHFGKMNDCFLLEISDSGAAFDIQTYQTFGSEPFTSHKEDGGSGTGLMDIWKIKKEYKASLYIYEYESETNGYTKKISFLFDGKNHFLLKTYRDKEVRNALIRGDLHVFSHDSSNT